jgi:SapC
MTHIVPLNKVTHRSLKVDPRASAAYGDNQHFVQVIVNEFPHLAVHYPILFSKDKNTGQFYCGVMLGFEEGENLFLDRWVVREFYRPLALQRGPFYTHGQEVAIDLDHPRVGAEGGQPIFNEHGYPTKYLQSIIWAFQDLKPGIETTRIFVARLTELKLIEPVDIEVECEDGATRHCHGLYTVNQETLSGLPDAAVVELFRRGYMRLMHLMIGSLKHVPLMARKKNDRLLEPTETLAATRTPTLG